MPGAPSSVLVPSSRLIPTFPWVGSRSSAAVFLAGFCSRASVVPLHIFGTSPLFRPRTQQFAADRNLDVSLGNSF